MAHNFQNNFNAMLRPPILVDPTQQQQQQQYGHLMPNSNWQIENMPWAQPDNLGAISTFKFDAPTRCLDERTRRALWHVKRKSEPNPTVAPPPKQFITEEKITAHFNGLHISSNFTKNDNSPSISSMEHDTSVGSSTTFSSFQDYRVTTKELQEKLRNANRIILCEDLKKMQQEQNGTNILTPIIPEALMNRMEKPCKSLVLWQPPKNLELLHRKNDEELEKASSTTNKQDEIIEDVEFSETDDIDDLNNNTCNVDHYKFNVGMDEDL